MLLITRAHFLAGHLALIATTGISSLCNHKQAASTSATINTIDMSQSPDYGIWEAVLKAHVKPTLIRGIAVNSVDYAGIRNDPNFDVFVKSLETAPTSGLGKDAEYALWINSYNALAIRTVTQNACKKKFLGLKKCKITSIKDVGTLVSPVWKKPAGVVGGATLSLDDIENVKLRAPTDYPADPLLHACIVCASVSCPDVALTAYKPETLRSDMEANMRHFLANPKKGLALDRPGGVITLSKVFQWFADDFTKAGHATVLDALLRYMSDDVKAYVEEHKGTLRTEYFEYDWGLNGPSPGAPGKRGRC